MSNPLVYQPYSIDRGIEINHLESYRIEVIHDTDGMTVLSLFLPQRERPVRMRLEAEQRDHLVGLLQGGLPAAAQ